ncbi:PDC sensor domain-containing protein [Cohnella silvisoli]|uniref:PDC sensor domain-containing protein n=1 Tax=Cohnella silvisoli TaxID=2873699 RepID=A0ABV1KWY9_9BACL|nr:PDC sensor domain-containing protein [Cohnella silvisoli]MCD9023776.1 PDC sensor domain-containing protein [Cohnella silvisoli]
MAMVKLRGMFGSMFVKLFLALSLASLLVFSGQMYSALGSSRQALMQQKSEDMTMFMEQTGQYLDLYLQNIRNILISVSDRMNDDLLANPVAMQRMLQEQIERNIGIVSFLYIQTDDGTIVSSNQLAYGVVGHPQLPGLFRISEETYGQVKWSEPYYSPMLTDQTIAFAIGFKNRPGKVLAEINRGKEVVYRFASNSLGDRTERIDLIYDGGAALSCLGLGGSEAAVLTTDRKLLQVDLVKGTVGTTAVLPAGADLTQLHCVLDQNTLVASDREGAVYVVNGEGDGIRRLDGIRLSSNDASIVRLDGERIIFSGVNDEILMYDLPSERCVTLNVKTPSIKGRAFRATLTGGAVLADGTMVGGTADGLLFTLSPDQHKVTAYGRLYSSGQLRNFIKLNGDSILGVYGGGRDAGHVFHYSRDGSFVDWGRPRVIKDNIQLYSLDSEWASIHVISCLAYSQEDDCLYVASGEQYGCVIRYQGNGFAVKRCLES